MIKPKTATQIEVMRAGGRIAASVLQELIAQTREGVTTAALEEEALRLIAQAGAAPSFNKEPGYHWATCINLNEGVVHGIPGPRVIKDGDVVSLDLGVYYQGFHSDLAWTFVVGQAKDPEIEPFLLAGRQALEAVIALCRPGHHLGDLSAKISEVIEGAGYSIVRELTGHGIGRHLHEEPLIPGFGEPGTGPKLTEGMTLALEVIYALDQPDIVLGPDDWTFTTVDGRIAGLFEHSVAVTKAEPLILTAI